MSQLGKGEQLLMGMLHYDFMIRALIAGLITGLICPALGVFLVLRRYSFMADTLAHISLAGVAFGLLIGVAADFSPLLTLVVAIIGALMVDHLRVRSRLSADALLALVMSGGLALAVVFFGLSRGGALDITSYLFGSLMTVSAADLWLILIVGAAVLLFLIFMSKELYFICSDEEAARVSGLPVDLLNRIFILLVAMTVAVSLRVVGTLLVGALMVIPVLTSLIVGRSFRQVVYLSLVLGVSSSLLGLTASYQFGLAAGGCVVLVALAFFIVSYGIKQLFTLFKKRNVVNNE
ncbi:MAG: metal ABC transporter permease [Thermoanaerobacterales bacterium]|nr:metal ABC transporter permease [Thermoanaerobacterales bacterium]